VSIAISGLNLLSGASQTRNRRYNIQITTSGEKVAKKKLLLSICGRPTLPVGPRTTEQTCFPATVFQCLSKSGRTACSPSNRPRPRVVALSCRPSWYKPVLWRYRLQFPMGSIPRKLDIIFLTFLDFGGWLISEYCLQRGHGCSFPNSTC
jgi:hypothetical protein